MVNAILAKRVNHIVTKGDNPAWPKGSKSRGFSIMERKRNYIGKVRDWADDRLRRMCGRITPGKRLAVILVMFFFLGGLSIYITVSSIYNIGKRDGRRLQIEHIRQLPLHGNDTTKSINPLNRPQYGRSTEE